MLCVSFAPGSEFNMGTIWVWRLMVSNAHQVSLSSRSVLYSEHYLPLRDSSDDNHQHANALY